MKKILFVTKSLDSGGTEVSLINLLKKISSNKNYDITLALLKREGIYLADVPNSVKIVEIYNDNAKKMIEPLNLSKDSKNLFFIIKKIFLKILNKFNFKFMYNYLLENVNCLDEKFDIAIDFHGYGYFGTFYLINKVNCDNKIMFVHDEKIDWFEKILSEINKLDLILCVSESCKKIVYNKYERYIKKADICRNVLDVNKIVALSNEKLPLSLSKNCNLLTIGRLEYQKGYDLLIQIASKLKMNNVKFTWYIIGKGSLEQEITADIEKYGLQENVILLGMIKNPYPYIKACDVYVQTSRHEGYGIAIAEARILNKPIVATALDCIKEQIKDNETGLLCDFIVDDFYDKISLLINDKDKSNELIVNLKSKYNNDNNDFENIIDKM